MHGEPTLTRFAPAKINLFLEVAGRRADGYHDVATVMETIAIGDAVAVAPADVLEVTADRDDVPSGSENVAHRIVRAAEEVLGRSLPAAIRIEKRIPPGSGLGAGSSDAVAALLLVLELHGIRASPDALRTIAAAVGSDTPFFVEGGLALCTGRGEVAAPLPQVGARHVVVVLPASECSTARVYGALDASADRRDPAAVLAALERGSTLASPPDSAAVFNRLAAAADRAYPALAARRSHLEHLAGRSPLLSGSGGSHLFLCATQDEARELASRLRAADPSLDVRAAASYRGVP